MNYISLERMISIIKILTERKIFINNSHSAIFSSFDNRLDVVYFPKHGDLLDELDLKTDLYKDCLYKPVKDVDVYLDNVIISI